LECFQCGGEGQIGGDADQRKAITGIVPGKTSGISGSGKRTGPFVCIFLVFLIILTWLIHIPVYSFYLL